MMEKRSSSKVVCLKLLRCEEEEEKETEDLVGPLENGMSQNRDRLWERGSTPNGADTIRVSVELDGV